MSDQPTPDNDATQAEVEKKDVLRTPDGQEIDLGITGTMKLDPPGRKSNPNRLASVKYAVAGLLYVLTHEQSIKLATIVTAIVIVIGLWLQINVLSWALLTFAIGGVWVTECLNTAIEAAIDLGTSDPHPLAKIGKDVASTAALVSSIVFVVIVVLILLPRLLDRIAG
ncbi:MAG: diacylglycerol kinase family protein [Anaerolinea sp.]|nr:diacylglycerol kinase family protein [Anaerolinea sp.]